MKTLLLASHDRGGANVIAAMLRSSAWLTRQRQLLLMEGPAIAVLASGNPQTFRITSLAEAEALHPDLVVCGTSFHSELERNAILWANGQGIPSISLIDSWMNLSARYWHPRLNRYCLPTVVSVVDQESRTRLQEELGSGGPCIEVTGQPHLQGLMNLQPDQTVPDSNQVKRVLFCSEPMRQAYNRNGELGYDQFSVFEQLIALFERDASAVVVELKLHPSEDPQSWNELLARHPASGPVQIVRTHDELSLAFKRADVVLGLISMALLEAVLAARPVYSCQFGRKQRLAEEITRYMTVCESAEELYWCLQSPLMPLQRPPTALALIVNRSVERLEAVLIRLANDWRCSIPNTALR
jgi:hypothetical protein